MGRVTLPLACTQPLWEPNLVSLGVETQIRYSPTQNDRISVNGTFERATFRRPGSGCGNPPPQALTTSDCVYVDSADQGLTANGYVAVNLEGATAAHTPKWAGSLGYDHDFHMGNYRLTVGAQAFYSDWYYAHPDYVFVQDVQPAYWLENLSASFAPTNSDFWSVSGYVRNLRNYAVKESFLPATTIGDPRTMGVTLSLKW